MRVPNADTPPDRDRAAPSSRLMRRDGRFWGPDRHGPCPCGSGRPAHRCHGRDDGSWRAEPWTLRPHRLTGHANPHCYAARLRDCSQQLSDEQYISRTVLDAVGQRPLLTGLPFPAGLYRRPENAARHTAVLCQRHQRLLAPLDREASRAFRALRRFETVSDRRGFRPGDDVELLSGPRLEAWLLKTHFGMLAAQQATAGGAPAAAWRDKAEPVLLGVLLGGQPWPSDWGLWITAPGMSTASAADPAVGPCTWVGSAFGGVVEFPRFPLQLLLGSPGQPEAVYRPGGLIVRDEHANAHQVLALGWPEHPGGPPVISIRLHGPAQEQWP